MLVVGLTGGIGSGKTTVANFFAELNIPHIDSDQLAREAVLPTTEALTKIIERYGSRILLDNGELNRKALRETIFEIPAERLWLEALLHPIIRDKMQQALNHLNAPYALLVIPLLIDRPANPLVQRVLAVDTTQELQRQRVTIRDQIAPERIEAILKVQITRDRLIASADDVIVNNHNLDFLKEQVLTLHHKYLQLASSKQ